MNKILLTLACVVSLALPAQAAVDRNIDQAALALAASVVCGPHAFFENAWEMNIQRYQSRTQLSRGVVESMVYNQSLRLIPDFRRDQISLCRKALAAAQSYGRRIQ